MGKGRVESENLKRQKGDLKNYFFHSEKGMKVLSSFILGE